MSGWIRRPAPPHRCERPKVETGLIGGVWRCTCKKLWIHRTGWWFGDFPLRFRLTVPAWHKARWWEKVRWLGDLGQRDDALEN